MVEKGKFNGRFNHFDKVDDYSKKKKGFINKQLFKEKLKVLVNGNKYQLGMYSIKQGPKKYDDDDYQLEFWDLQTLREKTMKFINSLESEGYEPIFLFDLIYRDTKEHAEKHFEKINDELRRKIRRAPPNMSIMFFYLLKSLNVEAHLCLYGMKETMCYRAETDGVDIFVGEVDSDGTIKSKYNSKFKSNFVSSKNYQDSKKIKYNSIETNEPHEFETLSNRLIIDPSGKMSKGETVHVGFGHPTPLLSILDSPYIAMKNLYAALYNRAGIKIKIIHDIPVWDEKQDLTKNFEQTIEPETAKEKDFALLDDYEKAVESIFDLNPSKLNSYSDSLKITPLNWRNHVFCLYSLTILVWVLGQKKEENRNLFKELEKVALKYFKEIQGENKK